MVTSPGLDPQCTLTSFVQPHTLDLFKGYPTVLTCFVLIIECLYFVLYFCILCVSLAFARPVLCSILMHILNFFLVLWLGALGQGGISVPGGGFLHEGPLRSV